METEVRKATNGEFEFGDGKYPFDSDSFAVNVRSDDAVAKQGQAPQSKCAGVAAGRTSFKAFRASTPLES